MFLLLLMCCVSVCSYLFESILDPFMDHVSVATNNQDQYLAIYIHLY